MKKAVVTVITDTSGRVLLLKRGSDHKHFPNQWCLPGGKVDYIREDIITSSSETITRRWETDAEAAIRECIEETGYVPSLIQDTHITATGSDQEFTVHVFKCLDEIPFDYDVSTNGIDYSKSITREFPNGEHVEFYFFEVSRLPKDIGTLTKKIITQIL